MQLFINRDKAARNTFSNSPLMKEISEICGELHPAAGGKGLKDSIRMIRKLVLQGAANGNNKPEMDRDREVGPRSVGKGVWLRVVLSC